MKKYIFILFALTYGLVSSAQRTTTKSEKISYATHETDTEQSLKGSFPIERSEKVETAFLSALGKADQSSAKGSTWTGSYYTAHMTATSFKANLDKEKASAKEIGMFKRLTAALYKALDQPQPPQVPKPND